MDDSIKKKLSLAFEKRKCNKIYKEDDCFDLIPYIVFPKCHCLIGNYVDTEVHSFYN